MSGNITELMRWSQIPVEVSNLRMNERKLYGDPNKSISNEAIWQADLSQKNRMRTSMSSFHGHKIPMGVLEGAPPGYDYWGLMQKPVSSTRPALSSLNVTEVPQIIQINAKREMKNRDELNRVIFAGTQNNQYLPAQVPY